MSKIDILTIGGAVEDITLFTSDGVILENPKKDLTCLKLLAFEYGAKMKIDAANFSFGGGAQNAAVCFSRLGFKTAALLSVGDDGYGENIIKNLKANKVETRYVGMQKESRTGFSFILTDKKTSEHVAFSYRGANSDLRADNKILKEISPRWAYLTSLSGDWKKVLENIFNWKKNEKVKVAWNPGKFQLEAGYGILKKYLKMADVLILNKDEAIELDLNSPCVILNEPACKCGGVKDPVVKQKNTGILRPPGARAQNDAFRQRVNGNGKSCDNIRKLIFSLYNVMEQEKILVITDGKNGAYAYDGNNIYYAPIKDVKRVNTTGVGDAFGSSFIAGLELYSGNIKKALDLGILNTSSVVGKKGAENGLLYKSRIKSLP